MFICSFQKIVSKILFSLVLLFLLLWAGAAEGKAQECFIVSSSHHTIILDWNQTTHPGGSYPRVIVNSSTCTVTATANQPWIQFSGPFLIATNQWGMTLNLAFNESVNQRTGTLTFRTGNSTVSVTIGQFGRPQNQVAIYGHITNGNTSLSGVSVALSGSSSATTTTDVNGAYSFNNLISAGNYTVTPTRPGFTFTPPSQTFNNITSNQTANFTAIPIQEPLPQCVQPEPGWDFGNVPIGTTVERVFNFTNNSSTSYTPQNFTLEGTADFCIKDNTCENVLLAPGQSCSWTASFTPKASGTRINREYNIVTAQSQSGSQCMGLSGTGKLNADFVFPLYQSSAPWGSKLYAYCTDSTIMPPYTIGARGCALTSLTMAINYLRRAAPIPSPIFLENPESLQVFALSDGINGFDRGLPADACIRGRKGNEVNFGNIVSNYSIPFSQTRKPFQWNISSIKSIGNPNAATQLSSSLESGYPMIVGIVHKRNLARCNVQTPPANCYYKGHFVLVTKDLQGGSFQVVDPGNSSATTLQSVINYRSSKGAVGWQSVGYVSVKDNAYNLPRQARNCTPNGLCDEYANISPTVNSNDSSIMVVSDEKVDFLIVNSQGQRTGYDDTTGNIVEEILNSSYNLENIFTMDDSEPTNAVGSANINQPQNGVYQIIVKGAQQGQYNITVSRTNQYGQPLSPLNFTDTIQVGETKTHSFTFSTSESVADFDGDGKTDISIFRPSVGQWWYQRSSDNVVPAYTFGISTDKIVPADYTGDGKTDIAFFRPSTSQWFVLRSEDNTFFAAPFGNSTDIPAPGDYDGDGKADIAVFRPVDGTWFILRSSNNTVFAVPFGIAQDIPVVADYDGDGKSDVAIYRPMGGSGSGEWWILKSSGGVFATPFGSATDKPVQGDYTGDGKADCAFFRPSTGQWFVLRSEDLTFFAAPFGANGDIPSAGDYDGDGKFDFAVFRPSSATWFVLKSSGGTQIQAFGTTGDIPVPSAFVP